jgi:hypothetical protein
MKNQQEYIEMLKEEIKSLKEKMKLSATGNEVS